MIIFKIILDILFVEIKSASAERLKLCLCLPSLKPKTEQARSCISCEDLRVQKE